MSNEVTVADDPDSSEEPDANNPAAAEKEIDSVAEAVADDLQDRFSKMRSGDKDTESNPFVVDMDDSGDVPREYLNERTIPIT